MYKLILGGLLLAAAVSPASAMMSSSSLNNSKDSLDVKAPFSEQRHAIENKLSDGKTYAEISANDRSLVREALARISNTLDSGSIDSLSDAQKTAVFNDQELVNTILTKASQDSRVVCEMVSQVGSHRKVSVCQTVAERRRIRERSQDNMRNMNRPAQLKSN